jgi:putative membrane-bound dehydrogenase-like protein
MHQRLSRSHFLARRSPLNYLILALLGAASSLRAADLVAVPALGLRVARGFEVTLFANETMANDIYAMAIDPRGNVVVTSQGYVRTLYDNNGDGIADDSEDFASTPTGGMGLCFDGNDLLFVGDDALWRFRDADADGQADAGPERILPLSFREHGGHAVRVGPDGAWYVIGGNDTKFDPTLISLSALPSRKIEGGALLRLSPDGRNPEVIAHGFRNPYDFDFNNDGEIFTYDSDVERDVFLPWYSPTRIYHVAPGGHHGWRLDGYQRSWNRRDYYADTVPVLAEMGRGSPTGVACYQHLQFPPYYREGLFALDWTFGRVHFLPLRPDGASYDTTPEVFLESVGTQGFAPTDVAVAPDGSLFISTGGRKTRGAVYRVRYVAEPALQTFATNWYWNAASDLQIVLQSPQPLEAWSRARWVPLAQRIGPGPFEIAAADNRVPPDQRVRAIEVLTEVHEGLSADAANRCAVANTPLVRARVAWSLGVAPTQNIAPILLGLARDAAPYVRCAALESIRRNARQLDLVTLQQALAVNLAHPDKRVHQAAALLATQLPEPAWKALWVQQQGGLPQARLTTALAHVWRSGLSQVNTAVVETALAVLNQSRIASHRTDALRLIVLALGDYRLDKPTVEVYTAYQTTLSFTNQAALSSRIQKALVALLPSGDATTDQEAARVLAMLEATDPTIPGKVVQFLTERTSPTADFHYLAVLSCLKTPALTNFTVKIAAAILSLDRKLDGLQQRPKQMWPIRLAEVTQGLLKQDPKLADAMLQHPDLIRAAHLELVPLLGSSRYLACARRFFDVVQRNPNFPWNTELIELLSALPAEEVRPIFRRQLANAALRDRLILELASAPQVEDRDKYIAGLGSIRLDVARASMTALMQLPNDTTARAHVATLRLLRSLLKTAGEQTSRAQTLLLLTRLTGQKFTVNEAGTDLAKAYQPVFDWFATRQPDVFRQLDSDDQEHPTKWDQFYKGVPWGRGDATRGAAIFAERACQSCHAGSRPMGPDLAGVTQRFSATDLFNTIIFPSRDIAPAYRMTTYQMRDGQTYNGLLAFESADGVIIQTGAASTVRLSETDIVSRQLSSVSFMPSGLLNGLLPQGFADLYAYLKTLQPR